VIITLHALHNKLSCVSRLSCSPRRAVSSVLHSTACDTPRIQLFSIPKCMG